jgi:putative aldouronate transport system substrate-binding protein
MKKTKKYLALPFFIIMIAGLLAACANNSSNERNKNDNSPSVSNKGEKNETVTLDIVVNNAGRQIPDGLTSEDNPYINYVKENTGLEFKFNFPPQDAYQERLNIIMASGDLPDIIRTNDAAWVVKYINQKALRPLNDAIDKYGQDLKNIISQEAWENVTIDGQIYAVPSQAEVLGSEIMYIRKDWLDHLGLNPPKTLEEYENVMRAFVNDDPNNSGKNDTMGLIFQEDLLRTSPFFGAFGVAVTKDQWYEQDGQLVNSRILPETKEALERLAEWYQEGLIDEEFALNKGSNVNEKIANGSAGLFAAMWYDTRGPILTNQQNDPNAEWIAIDFPVGPEGKFGTFGTDIVQGYSVVPVTSDNVEFVVKLLNFIAGDGYSNLKLGFEDEVWTMENGLMVTNFEEHNKHIYRGTIHSLADSNTNEVRQMRLDSLGLEFKLIDNIEQIEAAGIYSEFLAMPTPAMGRYGASLDMLFYEVATKIIMGNEPIDAFDTFVTEWKEQGGNEMTAEANEWFKK